MDASIESFINYRVNRLKDISLEIFSEDERNLIPDCCALVENFCLNRPKSAFFQKAKGTKLIRKDLKYFIPATYGVDIRPFTSGGKLDFDKQKFLEQKDKREEKRGLLKIFARFMILILTYDLLTVDITDFHEVDFELIMKTEQRNAEFFTIFTEFLADVLDIPSHSKVLKLRKGSIKFRTRSDLANESHATVLRLVEAGIIPVNVEKLDQVFEQICSKKSTWIDTPKLTLDDSEKMVVNVKKLLENPISDQILMKVLQYRYHLSSYLYTAGFYRQRLKKRTLLSENVFNALQNLPAISDESRSDLSEFLIGDNSNSLFKRAGFEFDPLPKETGVNWKIWERKSVYLGEKPDFPNRSPQYINIPLKTEKSTRKPVCILLDISSSMSDCLDIALKTLGILFSKLQGFPINIVLFSTCAGVTHKGIPIVSKGTPLHQEIPWLMKLVDSVRKGLFLGGTTSIGNGILLGKAIALSISQKMDKHQSWKDQNGIAAHCIIISDNLHNTPRDISEKDTDGNYIVDSRKNVITHSAEVGCSIHNLVCCSPTNGMDKCLYKVQVIKYIEVIANQYFITDKQGMTIEKRIEKDLVMTVLSHKPKTLLFRYKNEDSFTLVNTWLKSTRLDQLTKSIASLVIYLRQQIRMNSEMYDALEFVGREFGVGPEQLLESVIDMDKVFRIYELMVKENQVVLEDLDSSIFDADPLQIFDISHCIANAQRKIHPFSTTPVFVQLKEALDRRKDFDNELYFGLNNLERLDSAAEFIFQQIESMR